MLLRLTAVYMATFLQKRMLSVFVRSSGLSIRQSLPARHNPSLKRKKNLAANKKKKTPVISSPAV